MRYPVRHTGSSDSPNVRVLSLPRNEERVLQQILRTVTDNQRLLCALMSDYRPVKRCQRRTARVSEPPVIRTPRDIWDLLGEEMSTLAQEQLRVLILDTKHRLVTCELVYQGTVDSIVVRVAELLRPAVSVNAPAVLLVHNHPSGDPTPSPEDIRTTEQAMKGGELLDIEVLDHVILGKERRFTSLVGRGLVRGVPVNEAA